MRGRRWEGVLDCLEGLLFGVQSCVLFGCANGHGQRFQTFLLVIHGHVGGASSTFGWSFPWLATVSSLELWETFGTLGYHLVGSPGVSLRLHPILAQELVLYLAGVWLGTKHCDSMAAGGCREGLPAEREQTNMFLRAHGAFCYFCCNCICILKRNKLHIIFEYTLCKCIFLARVAGKRLGLSWFCIMQIVHGQAGADIFKKILNNYTSRRASAFGLSPRVHRFNVSSLL